jgi:putative tryptophan/tyrosine transport system substrate-binding protein
VKFGLVASMNRPGGNITGVSFLANTLLAKQLQLLRGLSAGSGVVALLDGERTTALSPSCLRLCGRNR